MKSTSDRLIYRKFQFKIPIRKLISQERSSVKAPHKDNKG